MLQSVSSVFVVYRHKTIKGSPDPTHANGTNKPCIFDGAGYMKEVFERSQNTVLLTSTQATI